MHAKASNNAATIKAHGLTLPQSGILRRRLRKVLPQIKAGVRAPGAMCRYLHGL